MLEVDGVRKSYGDLRALDGVTLEIAAGQILALLGPNGAGKTTLISIVAGLLRPDAGSVRVGGFDIRTAPMQARAMLGIAPQELALYAEQTVRKNLRFFGTLAGLAAHDLAARIDEVAATLELTDLLDTRAQVLSGGEKRRAHAAVALLSSPPLLLLDEPTAGVDVHTRAKMLDVIARLARDGAAVCYATHYLEEVETLGATVAIMESGGIVARGSVDELVAASGGGVVEIRFDGAVPPGVQSLGSVGDDGETLRIEASDPNAVLPSTLAAIAPASDQIASIEIVRPSLESVYLGLTGRRFDPSGGGQSA